MASTKTNAAAWIPSAKATPFEIKDAPYPSADSGEVVIKTAFVAINPLDFKIQDTNPAIGGRELKYPTVLGADVSGTVIEVGVDVKQLKVGDRVIANTNGAQTGRPAHGAFQQIVKLEVSSTVLIPASMPFEKAVVLPLAIDTAAAGLFPQDQMALSTFGLGNASAKAPGSGSVVLIWGGSSSIGACAIQMAHAAGYEVFTTASKRNHDLCTSIGASQVFDYSDPQVVDHIVSGLKGKQVSGVLDCVVDAEKTVKSLATILAQSEGKKKITGVLGAPDIELPEGVEFQRLSIPSYRQGEIFGIVHAWMAKALADGSLKPKPDPKIIGEGLEAIQTGVDTVRNGVSATKIVVKL